MSMVSRVICAGVAIVCVIGLEWYARKGEGLTDNGRKFLRVVYSVVAGVLLVAAVMG